MTRLLGLDPADGPQLKHYTDSFFRLFAPLQGAETLTRVNTDLAAFRTHLTGAITSGRFAAHGLLAQCPADTGEARAFIDNAILLFADGIENIERGCATLVATLAAHGALAPGVNLDSKIAEGLRLETPAQIIARGAREDIEIAGRPISAGTPVFLGLGAANRDPDVFPNPGAFDPARDQTNTLTFGRGRHSCVGALLAERQFAAFLGALIARGATVPRQQIRYLPRVGHCWPEALEIDLS